MPTPRRIREATGRHRKLPLRNCQSAYRSQRGINSAKLDLCSLHHHEILQQNIVQSRIHQEILALEAAIEIADPDDEEVHHHRLELDLLEASLLTSETIREDLIFQESLHFDIHNKQQVEYTPHRNRSINDFDNRKAMGWVGWNVEQLRQIARQFDMDEGTIRLQGYSFSREEFF